METSLERNKFVDTYFLTKVPTAKEAQRQKKMKEEGSEGSVWAMEA